MIETAKLTTGALQRIHARLVNVKRSEVEAKVFYAVENELRKRNEL